MCDTIDLNMFIAAAHCVVSEKLEVVEWKPSAVRLGEHNLQTDKDCEDVF